VLEDLSDTEHIVLISLLSLMQSACKEFFCSILVYLVKPAVVVLFDDYIVLRKTRLHYCSVLFRCYCRSSCSNWRIRR